MVLNVFDINLLDENLSEDQQQKNILELANDTQYLNQQFLQPGEKKHWVNAARVLQTRGFPKINDVFQGMLEWLKDVNWPGTFTIIEILKTCDKTCLVPHIEMACIKGIVEGDESWLYHLASLITYCELNKSDFSNYLIYEIIVNIYNSEG